jgi:hypothetical protein
MSKIILKKSSVIEDGVPKAPAATDLDYGELAINYASGLLYYKTATNTIGILANAAAIPSTTSQNNWNTAYTQRLQWDGGSTNLVAATGRTSLGATTIGGNLFTLTNPSAITFPRFNADNTVSSLNAADFRTAIDVPSTSHTHSYLPLSGGTLTGVLTSSINNAYGRLDGIDQYHSIILRGTVSGTTSQTITAGDTSEFIEYGGSWNFRQVNTTTNKIWASVNTTGITWNDNQVIHAGNYTTYTDPKYLQIGRTSTSGAGITTESLILYLDFNNKNCSIPLKNLCGTDYAITNTNITITTKEGIGATYNNGTGGYLIVDGITLGTTMTYEAWAWADGFNNYDTIFDNGSERPLLGTNGGTMVSYPDYGSGPVLATGRWYHLVWVFSAGSTYHYINGQLEGQGTYAVGQFTNLNKLWIGGDGGGETWNGYIAIARVYNKALDVSEITRNFEAERTRFFRPWLATTNVGTEYTAQNGFTLAGASTEWSNAGFHIGNAGYAYSGTSDPANSSGGSEYIDYLVPHGAKTCYINHLAWDSGGYFDVYGKRSSGEYKFLARINCFQNASNNSTGNTHDGVRVDKVSSLELYTHIRLHQRKGRIHLMGLGWTAEEDQDFTTNDYTHWDNLFGLPGTILHTNNYSSYALPLTGGTLTGGLTINAALSVQQYNEASYRKWDYSWGGAQDLNWYRVATLRSTVTDGWRGTSGKITVYDENSNHGVATRTEFTAYFTAQYSSGGSPLDTGIIYPGPGASNYIRLYKVDTRHYEVQVRQLYDWRLMGAILEIDEDTGNLSSFDTTLQTANTTGTVVNNSSEYSENINIIGSAGKLTTARTLTIGSTGKTFDGSANVSWSLAEIGAQATLTSGTNIKTINGTSLLGSGDITISGGGGGSGVTPWSRKTSNYTAAIGDRLIADTTSGTFTITLPASPTTGSEVIIADGYDYRINSLTVARNGNTIEGLTDDVTLDIGGIVTTFVYDGTTWEIYISHGAGGGTIANDTTTASDLFYPTMAYNATSGIFSQVKVSSSKLYFNPSTGQLNSTNFNSLSDASEKRDIQVINNALELVKQMEGVFFNWKDTGLPGTGVIADNMLKILPEVVSVSDTGKKSVAYGNLVGVLIEAIKDLSAKVDNLIAKE